MKISEEVKGIENNPNLSNPLDLNYIWEKTGDLCNVIYEYPDYLIPKGRAFGSWGGQYSAYYLLDRMQQEILLEDCHLEQIEHLWYHPLKDYTSIINVSDFELQVYDSTQQYPYSNHVPKNESFAVPRAKSPLSDISFDNISIIPRNLTGKIKDLLEPLADFDMTIVTNNCFINRDASFSGNLTFLSETAEIPDYEDQVGRVYMINESDSAQSQLENLSAASGCIISQTTGLLSLNTTNCSYSIAYLSNNVGCTVKNMLAEHSYILAAMEDGVLNLLYNIQSKISYDYAIIDRIPDHLERRVIYDKDVAPLNSYFNKYYDSAKHLDSLNNLFPNQGQCRCIILFNSGDYHQMFPAEYNWDKVFKYGDNPAIPTFTVNYSVGKVIVEDPAPITVTGMINQELEEETQNDVGVTAHNVLGNITIPSNPGNKIAVISNRYDGWWGQTPGDSGLSAGIVLGLAKYLKDNNIVPKYNTTFLFTTGEEYGLRGAEYYADKHWSDNIVFWLVLDQLGFNQNDTIQEFSINLKSWKSNVFKAIIEDSHFEERTRYRTNIPILPIFGTEQAVYSQKFGQCCDSIICFAGDKNYEWDGYHRTGSNYTEGDSIKNMDKNYGNISAELAWNITKYFLLNPDCWFDGAVSYQNVDTSDDGDSSDDSISATFTVKSSLPVDKVRVRAFMKTEYNLTKFWKDFDFYATSEGTQKTITVTLPPTLLFSGEYHLYLQLFNSTGRIDEIVDEGSGTCDDSDLQTGEGYVLYPRGNSNANKPNDIQGPDTLKVFEPGTFNSSATDPNNDQLQYHWYWGGINTTRVGPYASGALCSINHTYFPPRGDRTIKVKVREDYKGQLYDGGLSDLYRYGSWSQWSDPFTVDVDPLIDFDMACTAAALAKSATQSTVLSSIQETNSIYEGFAFGGIAPYTYTWYFEYHIGPPPCNQTVTYNYSQPGIKTVTLNVIDYDNNSDEITANITIVNLSASYNISLPSLYTLPGENITFNDTSAVINNRCIENWTWDFGDGTVCYERNPTHYYNYPGLYNCTLTVTDDELETETYAKTIIINYDDTPPLVNSVFSSPGGIGYGINVSIMAVVTDDVSGVKTVHANITKPNNTTENLTMMHVVNDYYYCVFNDTTQPGTYNYSIWVVDQANNTDWIPDIGEFILDFDEPQITMTSTKPHTVGFGYNVTITTNVTDAGTGIDTVKVNIIYPDDTKGNYTMSYTTGNTYQYVFTDTWQTGQYDYAIWAIDNSNNINCSSGYHFQVSAEAIISIATLQDSYTGEEYINITDPLNPLENFTVIDRGLTWNTYYNATSGQNILETYQGPVNYQEMNGIWTPINNTISQLPSNHPAYVYGYRNGNDQGLYGVYFKSNAQQDWPVAFTYNKSDDPTIHAVRSKLVGVGYVDPQSNWSYQYLQNVQSSQGQVSAYSITYPGVFTGADVTWSYSNVGLKEEITLTNTTKTMLQNHPPSQYGLNDASSYLVFITRLDYQNLNLYNDSGLLDGNVTISDNGVEFRDILNQFKCSLPLGEAYELHNESNRQRLIYRIVHLNGNTYLLSGLKISKLNTMTFPVVIDPTLTAYSISDDGYIYNFGTNYNTVQNATSGTVNNNGAYITIGQKKQPSFPASTYYVYRGFVYFNTSALPSNAYLDDATLSLYKKDDYSVMDFDIIVQNGQPTYPHERMESGDYNKNYYSGNGGSLNTSGFTSGYNAIPLNNLNWINETGITKLCLRSSRDINGRTPTGNELVNVHSNEFLGMCPPKLVINYRNQSKIKNTGSTDIKGYLLMQVEYLDSSHSFPGSWVIDTEVVNEITPRTINSSSQIGLDLLFNGKIRASDLRNGAGNYRVYAAFRDPEGNILKTDDETELEAWWLFTKT
jgi:PKD repeat protein